MRVQSFNLLSTESVHCSRIATSFPPNHSNYLIQVRLYPHCLPPFASTLAAFLLDREKLQCSYGQVPRHARELAERCSLMGYCSCIVSRLGIAGKREYSLPPLRSGGAWNIAASWIHDRTYNLRTRFFPFSFISHQLLYFRPFIASFLNYLQGTVKAEGSDRYTPAQVGSQLLCKVCEGGWEFESKAFILWELLLCYIALAVKMVSGKVCLCVATQWIPLRTMLHNDLTPRLLSFESS